MIPPYKKSVLSKKPRRVCARRRKKLGSFFTATCAWGKIPLRLQVWNFCAARKNYARSRLQAPCRKIPKEFSTAKMPFLPKIRDERHTAFRGTTQIRRKALRTRFLITEDDPAAHFLAAAPGRTPQTATGQLAAGDWPSLGSREGADFPVRRFSDSNMYIYTIFFSAFQGKFLGTSTKKYRLWEKKVLYYDQVF